MKLMIAFLIKDHPVLLGINHVGLPVFLLARRRFGLGIDNCLGIIAGHMGDVTIWVATF